MDVVAELLPDLLRPALIVLSGVWILTLCAYAKRMSEGNVVVFFFSLFLMLVLSFTTLVFAMSVFALISAMF